MARRDPPPRPCHLWRLDLGQMSMKIEIKFFASLRKLLPPDADGSTAALEVEDGFTVAGLLEHLQVPKELAHLGLVNAVNIEGDQSRILQEGDSVSVFPPVAGGATDDPQQQAVCCQQAPGG